jgi:integrase
MRGHIVKRSNNSYSVVIRRGKDPNTGKYLQSWFTVKGTKKDAEKKLSEVLHQLDNGVFMKPGKTTLEEYLKKWLTDYAFSNLSPNTGANYQYIIQRHIVPSLGKITLTQLKPEHIQKYYSEKLTNGRFDGKGLSPRSVRHHHMCLHTALQNAMKMGLLIRNPVDAVDPPHCQRAEMNTINEIEIATLLESAKTTPYYSLFFMAIFTGMRRSELLALRWCDIDLPLCTASVSRSLHVLKGGRVIFRPTKTLKSRRSVSLSPSTAIMLKDHKEKQNVLRILSGNPLKEDDFVFSQIDGKPFLPNTVSHNWEKLVHKTGLNGVRFHDLRHSHASLMLKQGIHPKIVQERLGHSSIQVTLDTYSHVAPGLQEAAAKGFDDLFISKQSELL